MPKRKVTLRKTRRRTRRRQVGGAKRRLSEEELELALAMSQSLAQEEEQRKRRRRSSSSDEDIRRAMAASQMSMDEEGDVRRAIAASESSWEEEAAFRRAMNESPRERLHLQRLPGKKVANVERPSKTEKNYAPLVPTAAAAIPSTAPPQGSQPLDPPPGCASSRLPPMRYLDRGGNGDCQFLSIEHILQTLGYQGIAVPTLRGYAAEHVERGLSDAGVENLWAMERSLSRRYGSSPPPNLPRYHQDVPTAQKRRLLSGVIRRSGNLFWGEDTCARAIAFRLNVRILIVGHEECNIAIFGPLSATRVLCLYCRMGHYQVVYFQTPATRSWKCSLDLDVREDLQVYDRLDIIDMELVGEEWRTFMGGGGYHRITSGAPQRTLRYTL